MPNPPPIINEPGFSPEKEEDYDAADFRECDFSLENSRVVPRDRLPVCFTKPGGRFCPEKAAPGTMKIFRLVFRENLIGKSKIHAGTTDIAGFSHFLTIQR
jgi:hypothetical protein